MAVVSSFIPFYPKFFSLKNYVLLLLIMWGGPVLQTQAARQEPTPIKIDHLKKEFVGSRVSVKDREKITTLIAQLESNNPNPVMDPNLNNGTWRLVYTTFKPLFPLCGGTWTKDGSHSLQKHNLVTVFWQTIAENPNKCQNGVGPDIPRNLGSIGWKMDLSSRSSRKEARY